jgi:hypothetical protein
MLGGMTQDRSVSDDGFCYLHGSRIWMQLAWIPGQAPSGLWNHTASLVHDKTLVVIGGKVQKLCTSVRMLDLTTLAWLHVPVSVDIFGPRMLHAAASVGGSVLVHGGLVSSSSCSDELFCFDSVSRCMKRLAPQGKRPSCRCRHSLNTVVSYEGDAHVVCYGGSNDGETLNDLWILNCSVMVWQQVDVGGERPYLEGHTALTIKNRLTLLVGGYSRSKSGPSQLSWPGTGVFVLDLSTRVLEACSMVANFPQKLIGSAASRCGRCLIVFGGMKTDGSDDSNGAYVSADVFVECDKRIASSAHSGRPSDASTLILDRSQLATSNDDNDDDDDDDGNEEEEEDDESQSSNEMNRFAFLNPANVILSQAGSMDDLLRIEEQLQSTLEAISALREHGLLGIIESKCREFSVSQNQRQATESVTVWMDQVLSQAADKAFDVKLHVTLTLIKHISGCIMGETLLKEVCSSLACHHVGQAATLMCKLWTVMQSPDAMARLRMLCSKESGCFEFVVHSLRCIRAFCSLIPEIHHLHCDILVCECILSTAVASLNCLPAAAPSLSPLKLCFTSDIQRTCVELCCLAQPYFQRIVLRMPAPVSYEHVQRVLSSCGCVAVDSTAVQAISIFLVHMDLVEAQVIPPLKVLCRTDRLI